MADEIETAGIPGIYTSFKKNYLCQIIDNNKFIY